MALLMKYLQRRFCKSQLGGLEPLVLFDELEKHKHINVRQIDGIRLLETDLHRPHVYPKFTESRLLRGVAKQI